jgi:hypothetical protein
VEEEVAKVAIFSPQVSPQPADTSFTPGKEGELRKAAVMEPADVDQPKAVFLLLKIHTGAARSWGNSGFRSCV